MNPLQPLLSSPIWQHFYQLTQVPRPSGHMQPITDFMLAFGRSLSLDSSLDQAGNVIIRKPATIGMQNRQAVVLQSHLDMVPQKNSDTQHDFTQDPICPYIDGEWVKATGTTLGADNGIGVAAAMAILADTTLQHGPIEALFTVDEETGMYGAEGLSGDTLQADILLNLDSEHEGELFIGCAGGIDMEAQWQFAPASVPEGDIALEIHLSGLKGGHSGLDINLGRANANKLLFRLLKEAVADYEVRLASVKGGDLRNAIPREAKATITLPQAGVEELKELIESYEQMYNVEYRQTENRIMITVNQVETPATLIPQEIQDDLIHAIVGCRNGVARVDNQLGVIETSSSLGIVASDSDSIRVNILIRSSLESMKEALASSLESIFSLAGAKVSLYGSYPGWAPNAASPILEVMKMAYREQYHQEPKVQVVHAGLECGIIGAGYPQMDMISFGPTIKYPHSPDEKIEIASVAKFFDYLCLILTQIPIKCK